MMMSLSRPVRRVVALALLLLAGLAAWAGLVEPLLSAFEQREEGLQRSQRLIAEFGRKAAQRPVAEQRLHEARRQLAAATGYIEAPNPALASATLQNLVKSGIEGRGGMLRSLQALPPAKEASFQRLAVRIDAAAGADKLLDLLLAIEASRTPILRIESLDIRAPEGMRSPGTVPENAMLALRADIVGYLREGQP
jgi:hypothetical protein